MSYPASPRSAVSIWTTSRASPIKPSKNGCSRCSSPHDFKTRFQLLKFNSFKSVSSNCSLGRNCTMSLPSMPFAAFKTAFITAISAFPSAIIPNLISSEIVGNTTNQSFHPHFRQHHAMFSALFLGLDAFDLRFPFVITGYDIQPLAVIIQVHPV